jgi:large subunit ribosomal protein L19
VQAIGDVNRAKLYYLRAKVGKKARVREVHHGTAVSSARAQVEPSADGDEPVEEQPVADEQPVVHEPVAEEADGAEPEAEEPAAADEDGAEAAEVRPKARRSLRRRG